MVEPDQVRRAGVVGAGVIGGGWALHFLRMGLDVDVYDPAPGAERDLLRTVEETWPLLVRLGLREGESVDPLEELAGPRFLTGPHHARPQPLGPCNRRDVHLFARTADLDETAKHGRGHVGAATLRRDLAMSAQSSVEHCAAGRG